MSTFCAYLLSPETGPIRLNGIAVGDPGVPSAAAFCLLTVYASFLAHQSNRAAGVGDDSCINPLLFFQPEFWLFP